MFRRLFAPGLFARSLFARRRPAVRRRPWQALETLEPRCLLAICDAGYANVSVQILHDRVPDGIVNESSIYNGGDVAARAIDAQIDLLDAQGAVVDTLDTDYQGIVTFGGVCPGEYRLGLRLPEGVSLVPTTDPTLNVGNAFLPDGQTSNFHVVAGVAPLRYASVYATPTSVLPELEVWTDLNADGLWQAGEPAYAENDLSLDLYTADGFDQPPIGGYSGGFRQPYLRGEDGIYRPAASQFPTSELPGLYQFLVNHSELFNYQSNFGDLRISPIPAAADPGAVGNDFLSTSSRSRSLRVTSGAPAMRHQLGLYRMAGVSGVVWDDSTPDGMRAAAGEVLLGGVPVRLLDATGNVVASTYTAEGGAYAFNNVLPGTYLVEVERPENTAFAPADVATAGESSDSDIAPATGRSAFFTLVSNENKLLDAGLRGTSAVGSEIVGQIFHDANGNGVFDASESPYTGGVEVSLLAGYALATVATLTTGPDGVYHFPNLAAGTYSLLVLPPHGTTLSPAHRGVSDALDSDINRSQLYARPFPVAQHQRVTSIDAGIFDGARSTDAVSSLRITEVGFVGHGNSEFVEVKNIGSEPLDLSGVAFTAGIRFGFAAARINTLFPGELAVLVGSEQILATRFDVYDVNVLGLYGGDLNRTERLTLVGNHGASTIHSFRYNDDWFGLMDREIGAWTLTIVDQLAPVESWGTKWNWRPSSIMSGTPGRDDPQTIPNPGAVVINEILSRAADGTSDLVELHNTTDRPLDISYWYLGDSNRADSPVIYRTRYQFPGGTVIPPHGFKMLSRDADFGNLESPYALVPFGLSSYGESLNLFAADRFGALQGYIETVSFKSAPVGVSYGRHVTSDGAASFVPQTTTTLGGPNAGPTVGPIVISEIMYSNGLEPEYIELTNIGASDIPLTDDENRWELRSAVTFAFPLGTVLPAGGRVVVTADAAATRTAYNIPAETAVYGGWVGTLDNGGEIIDLVHVRPLEHKRNPAGNISTREYLVESFRYDDDAPWPVAADGTGRSLERRHLGAFGGEPTNWAASAEVGGTPGQANSVASTVDGDCNQDGLVNSGDIDFLSTLLRTGTTSTVHDLNSDGTFTRADVDYLITTMLHTTYGDADVNGRVSIADLGTLQRNFGRTTGARWSEGDFDGNGHVDRSDLAMLVTRFGAQGFQPAPSPGASITETSATPITPLRAARRVVTPTRAIATDAVLAANTPVAAKPLAVKPQRTTSRSPRAV